MHVVAYGARDQYMKGEPQFTFYKKTNYMADKKEKMSMPSASTGINVSQILTSVLKYLIEGLAIAIVAYALPQKKLKLDEVATIALVGAATFAILDMYAPGATADAARMGAGFGIGGNLVGFA